MFETDKSLEEMSIEELELTRRVWKDQAERAIFPLIEALVIGWNASSRFERTREIYDLKSGEVTISTYKGKRYFDPSKRDYLHYLGIQITVHNQTVANLVYDYYTQNLKSGSWSNMEHLFARPGNMDWISEVENLVQEWTAHDAEGKDQSTKQRRNRLLNILQKGSYA